MGKAINELRDALKDVRSVAVLTEADVSAESGIPTFRGDAGFCWERREKLFLN